VPGREYPSAGLVQATDGNLYGTAAGGGAFGQGCVNDIPGCGTIFAIGPDGGNLTVLHTFCPQAVLYQCADGFDPVAGLFQDTDGNLYGTTLQGGGTPHIAVGVGTIFSLSVGLGPFVEPQTTSGTVGATVKILGTNLIGAISVTFNGTAAVFTVVSASEITTTVPAGATSGPVEVVTPGGTLSSNVVFQVLP
jgi:uncharacterized repeat protein (TIGR03803 family)